MENKTFLICGEDCKTGDQTIPNRQAVLENVAANMPIGVEVVFDGCQLQCREVAPESGVVSAATKVSISSSGEVSNTPYAIGLGIDGPILKSRL